MWMGKEPFDLRLTALRMIRNLHIIAGITLLGTILFGGGYYVKNVLLQKDTAYEVTSTYRVSYVEEPSKSGDYYINEMTWNTYMDSKEFLDAVYAHLQEITIAVDSRFVNSAQDLATMIDARLASDVHVPSTVVTTTSDGWTIWIAQAVEATMVQEFVEQNEQVAAIQVIDPAMTASKVIPDVRPLRAFALSGVLSMFFAVVWFLLKEISRDGIWLPSTLRRSYGLKTVGTINSPELVPNLEHVFGNCAKVAVCSINVEVYSPDIIENLQKKLADDANMKQSDGKLKSIEWIPGGVPVCASELCATMRECDGILLLVKSGDYGGKYLESVLEYFDTQDIKVTAALLWDADEWLIRMYYGKVLK